MVDLRQPSIMPSQDGYLAVKNFPAEGSAPNKLSVVFQGQSLGWAVENERKTTALRRRLGAINGSEVVIVDVVDVRWLDE